MNLKKTREPFVKITNIDTKSKKQNYQMWKAILVFIDLKIIKISKCESSVYKMEYDAYMQRYFYKEF